MGKKINGLDFLLQLYVLGFEKISHIIFFINLYTSTDILMYVVLKSISFMSSSQKRFTDKLNNEGIKWFCD